MSEIHLNAGQFKIHCNRTALEMYLEGGWGGGKSFELAEFMLDRSAVAPPDAMSMAATLTTPMLRTITIPAMDAAFRRWGCVPRYNKSEKLYVWSPENRRIYLRTAKNPEQLDGPNLTHAALDESGMCKFEAYRRITSRVRDERRHIKTGELIVPQALFGGRPEGTRTWFNRRIQRIITGRARIPSIHVRVTTFENMRNLSRSYIARIRDAIEGDAQLEREVLYGEATDETGNVLGHVDNENVVEMKDPERGHIVLGCDFNVEHMVWVVGSWFPSRGILHIWGEFITATHLVDEQRGHPTLRRAPDYAMTDDHAAMTAEALIRRRVCSRERAGLIDATNQMVTCYPDASGKNRDTGAEMSDHALMKQAGFAIRVAPNNPSVRDSQKLVRYALKKRKLLICPKGAPLTLQAIRTHGRDRHGDPQKDFPTGELEVDHYTDCVRYLTWGVMPLRRKAGLVPVR